MVGWLVYVVLVFGGGVGWVEVVCGCDCVGWFLCIGSWVDVVFGWFGICLFSVYSYDRYVGYWWFCFFVGIL